jgi:hypothetical protein
MGIHSDILKNIIKYIVTAHPLLPFNWCKPKLHEISKVKILESIFSPVDHRPNYPQIACFRIKFPNSLNDFLLIQYFTAVPRTVFGA